MDHFHERIIERRIQANPNRYSGTSCANAIARQTLRNSSAFGHRLTQTGHSNPRFCYIYMRAGLNTTIFPGCRANIVTSNTSKPDLLEFRINKHRGFFALVARSIFSSFLSLPSRFFRWRDSFAIAWPFCSFPLACVHPLREEEREREREH